MKTLKLFNAVIAKPSNETTPFISDKGFVINPGALWAKEMIIDYYEKERLNGNDLNKTFHKSWEKIKNSTRFELLLEQIKHYCSTYGSNFRDEMYIPEEVLLIPKIKLTFKIINAYTKEEMQAKSLSLLTSGIALAEETVDDLISILVDDLNYSFTGKEGIRNKEAITKIAESYGVYPTNPVEFFRYIVYRTTDTTLLIKSDELVSLIKNRSYNPAPAFKQFGLEKLAEIFNRFKPLFLAYKTKCPKTINKISKLSKTYHKPMIGNPLNEATQRLLSKEDIKRLDNATPFALFKALSACYSRKEGQYLFVYRIRNGKSWVKEKQILAEINTKNFDFLLSYLKKRFSLTGLKVYLPEDIEYALPTSEKMFVGNIPTGTKFYGEKLAVGIYWENEWGAHDLDLSAINIGGKIGWNSSYVQGDGELMYSGDITDAENGAVEYLHATSGLTDPTLVLNNVYSGQHDAGYKIIIGKGDEIEHKYMMNPNNLFAEVKTESVQRKTILGLFMPGKKKQSFVVLNFGAGSTRIAGVTDLATTASLALYQQWNYPYTFEELIVALGAKVVRDKETADVDLSLDAIDKSTFIDLFTKTLV